VNEKGPRTSRASGVFANISQGEYALSRDASKPSSADAVYFSEPLESLSEFFVDLLL
jgi:hypothetical protein